ncbi:Scd6-like Sm domain-containing protein [Fomitopsis serialis]|uniref:Scd6-like Sm domain-containing protein n=1 Tax=Fomitopsis serialis TaxID=139415 RepID=UPI0020075E69|nr:Scd6-like Sm domain-containing protein [Neoantrodia serialis]KAH9930770.1 Scd6-like Sm domain-containing protein [Neoantrodia serialis]
MRRPPADHTSPFGRLETTPADAVPVYTTASGCTTRAILNSLSTSLHFCSTMASSFIGKPISLISHSDVRYRGILAGIDPAASTIQLSNVYSMGTESRRTVHSACARALPYIIFRASEVKDLAVDEPGPRRNVHDDPAASAPMLNNGFSTPYQQTFPPQSAASQQSQPSQSARQPPYPVRQPSAQPSAPQANGSSPGGSSPQSAQAAGSRPTRNNSVHTATASLETVERALGDLRVSQATANGAPVPRSGGRRGGRGQGGDLRVPATDFDFQSSNARFDKSAISPRGTPKTDGGADGEKDEKEKAAEEEAAYNPKRSFFDSLSSGSNGPSADARGGGRGGRRGGGRNRREEERERNVATFGEPGGVGLMGPGQYVGGWGGYGRRGGGRGRRGAAATAVAR